MLVTKYIEIDMAHRVPNHKSKCSNLHGHRYKVEVGVDDKVITTEGSSDEGMVIDFGDLKEVMMETIDAQYDHSGIFYSQDKNLEELKKISEEQNKPFTFVDFIPTAERLAQYWYEEIEPKLKERGVKIEFVRVYETPTSTAVYAK